MKIMSKKSKKSKKTGGGGFYPLDHTNPNLYFGRDTFELPNGDKYEGEYCAHRMGIVWREGHGTYITKEGQTYECDWSKDKIIEGSEVIITYPTGEIYSGLTKKDEYCGPGTYYFEHTMPISCNFEKNQPVGHIDLIDLNGRLWEGEVLPKYEGALLLPENVLYTQLDEDMGKGEEKSSWKKENATEMIFSVGEEEKNEGEDSDVMSYRQMEQLIFSKKPKVVDDVDFNNSDWCRKYLHFKNMKTTVLKKLLNEEELNCVEQEWYDKYMEFKLSTKKKTSKVSSEVISFSQNVKNIPIPIIYATKSTQNLEDEVEKKLQNNEDTHNSLHTEY